MGFWISEKDLLDAATICLCPNVPSGHTPLTWWRFKGITSLSIPYCPVTPIVRATPSVPGKIPLQK